MVGNEQTGLAQGIFLFPFSSGDCLPDSGQTPISTVLFMLPPKESLAEIFPKIPSLWLSLKKRKRKKSNKKRQKKMKTMSRVQLAP